MRVGGAIREGLGEGGLWVGEDNAETERGRVDFRIRSNTDLLGLHSKLQQYWRI
jgi:hypothetical protein